MNLFFDNHNHSQFSFDGRKTTVELSASRAKANGLGGMCFTDHCDFYVPPMKAAYENLVEEVFDVEAQQMEIDRVNSIIGGFRIFKGIELGLQSRCREQLRAHLAKHSFDQIIASVHYLEETDPFYGSYYEGKDWKTAYGNYLETLYTEMRWLEDFDIMGHFDYVARYASYPQTSILYKDFSDIIEAILTYLAHNGKALEINTKTYKDYKGRIPELDTDILLRFRELGGEFISLGSDSHDPARVGKDFGKFALIVKNAGFKYLTHFEGRKPVPLTID